MYSGVILGSYRSNRARCTEDEPMGVTKYQFPDKLPGELYDADKQCQWQFGPRARLCSFNFGKVRNGVTDTCDLVTE